MTDETKKQTAPAASFTRYNKGRSGEHIGVQWNVPMSDLPDNGSLYFSAQPVAAQPATNERGIIGELLLAALNEDYATISRMHNSQSEELLAAYAAITLPPAQPAAQPAALFITANTEEWLGSMGNIVDAKMELTFRTEPNSVYCVPMYAALPPAQPESKDADFHRGIIAALAVLTTHGNPHGSVLYEEIIGIVDKVALYATAELDDIEWAGLDPEFYAAIAAPKPKEGGGD